jgi:hypothetical protein
VGQLLVVVLVILGFFIAVGWFFGALVERLRHRRRLNGGRSPATAFEQGRAMGYESGLRAGYDAGFAEGNAAAATGRIEAGPPVGGGMSPAVGSPSPPWAKSTVHPVAAPVMPSGSMPSHESQFESQPESLDEQVLRSEAESPHGPGPESAAAQQSPQELADEKAARDLRTVNIALYSASLLLVAAGGLFIGAAVPGPARALTITVVVALFYVSGLVLHVRLPRLRPAAVAFAGTGLALLPVAGLLFGVLTGEGPVAWFGTSLVGTAAYLVAAVRLQSRVVAYLTLPFFLSIALSSVSLLGGALIWYFTCSIAVAAVLAAVAHAAPRRMPDTLSRAVQDTHRVLTPLALGASLFLGQALTDTDRALLWAVASAYYAVLLALLAVRRIEHFYALRLVGSVAAAFVAVASDASFLWGVLVVASCIGVQTIALLILATPVRGMLTGSIPDREEAGGASSGPERAGALYRIDVLVSFALTTFLAAIVVLSIALFPDSGYVADPDILVPVLLVLGVGAAVAVRLRGRAELLVLPGVLLAAVGPWLDPWRTELVVGLTVAYFLVRAARASALARERFGLAGRAAAVVLVPLAVLVHLPFLQVPDHRLEELAACAFVLASAANQVVETVRQRGRAVGSYGPWVICGASAMSLLAVMVLAGTAGGGPSLSVSIWATAVIGCVTTLVLPLPGEGFRRTGPSVMSGESMPTASSGRMSGPQATGIESVGPASLLVAGLAGAAGDFGLHAFEVLLALTVAYAGLMARRAIGRRRRGSYLLAAQAAFTSLTALVSADLELTVHGVLTIVAVGLALQEIVRVIIRVRLRDLGLQSISAWLSTGLLAVLPLVYWLLAGPDVRLGVLVVHLFLLLVVSATLFAVQGKDLAAYPSLYAVAALIIALSGVLTTAPAGWLPRAPLEPWAGALLAAACVVVLVLWRLHDDVPRLRVPIWAGSLLFAVEGFVLAFADGSGWDRPVVAAVVAVALFTLSRREGAPWLDAGAALSVIIFSTVLLQEVLRTTPGVLGTTTMLVLLGAVLAGALLFLARRLLPEGNDAVLRRRLLGGCSLGWAGVASLAAMVPTDQAVAGSVVLATVAVLAVREVPLAARPLVAEVAFLVVVGAAQRITWLSTDGMDFFWAAQWWVVALGLLAAYSYVQGNGRRGPVWLGSAAVVLSLTGLLTVAGGTVGAQIWSLCGHVVLLAAGVALSRRLFSLWGAIGIVLALLWFLRGYTFVLLTVAALSLLAFAVWKLNSQTRGSEAPAAPDHEDP